MSGFIQGEDRSQATLFPDRLDDYVAEDSAVRVIDVFLDDLDLSGLGFKTEPNDTGRPAYHPSTMLKLYVYGYLNQVHSSRRLEREAQRNVKLMWLTGRLAPDQQISLTDPDARSMKTRGNGIVGYNVQTAVVADRGYYRGEEIRDCETANITAYLPKPNTSPNRAKGQFDRKAFRYIACDDEYECPAGQRLVRHMTTQQQGKTIHAYWTFRCRMCAIKAQCTSGVHRKITRWEHEAVVENAQKRLERSPEMMRIRRATVEHPFGTLKAWMGSTHFLTRTLDRVNTEMSLHVLAYNLKRMMNIIGTKPLIEAIGA